MKSLTAIALVFTFIASARGQASTLASNAAPGAIESSSFIDALVKTASRFEVPLAVEWVKSPDMLKPVRVSPNGKTATQTLDDIISTHAEYAWQFEKGIVHVFPKAMVNDPRNPLNVVVTEVPNRLWTVRDADNFLFQSIGQAVRLTGPKVLSLSSPAGTEPQFQLAGHNAPVRDMLNQILTASKMRIWITTFPGNLPLTVKGFWETTPMYDPRGIKPEDQPFWILMRWGDIAWKRLEAPEP